MVFIISIALNIDPEESDGENQAHVKEIRRDPNVVDPSHRSEEKCQDAKQGGDRPIRERKIGETHEEEEEEQNRVKDEEAIYAEDADEGCGEKGISPGFRIKDLAARAFLEEDSLGAGVDLPIVADEVLFGEFQISVMGDALGHGEIDSLVREKEVPIGRRKVDEQGQAEEEHENEQDGLECVLFPGHSF